MKEKGLNDILNSKEREHTIGGPVKLEFIKPSESRLEFYTTIDLLDIVTKNMAPLFNNPNQKK